MQHPSSSVPFRDRRYTSQDGLSLFYREYGPPGAAVPLLCLPGLTRNARDFHDLGLRLGVERRVVCPDYRGRGRSDYDSDWRHYVGSTYIDDLRHLMAVAGLERVVAIGTSMGGLLAMGLGVAMPTALAGVVLNDVGPDVEPQGADRIIRYISKDRPQPDWDSAVRHLQQVLPRLGLPDEKAWRALAEGTFREGEDGMLHFDWDISIVKALQRPPEPVPDMWPLFRSLARLPVLVVRGERSDILTEETLAAMAAAHPGLQTVTVPGTGHAPTLDEPAARAAIGEFLGRLL